MQTSTVKFSNTLAPDVVALLNGEPAVTAARMGKARRMDVSELPKDWVGASLPSARKSGTRWQAVVFFQKGASDRLRFGWSSSETYQDRDEALEAAVLVADRLDVSEYLNEQGIVSLPLKQS